jgi:hypothetical protein
MTQEKVIDKLRKIKAQADSAQAIGSEAEALAFAEMLQSMLLKHNLGMTDIEFAAMEEEIKVEQRDVYYPPNPDATRNYGKDRKTRVKWMEDLAAVIASAHFCQVVVGHKTSRLQLIGRPDDIAVAEYMIVTLQRLADKMSYDAKQTYKAELQARYGHVGAAAGFRESWLVAFINRLVVRYREKRAEHTQANSTALVRFNRAEKAVKDFIAAQMETGGLVDSNKLATMRAHNGEGYKRGKDAAEAIRLDANGLNASKPGAQPKRLS